MPNNVTDQNHNPAEIIAAEIEPLLRERARSIDELALRLDRSAKKIKGAVEYLIGQGRAHRVAGHKGAFHIHAGPAPQKPGPAGGDAASTSGGSRPSGAPPDSTEGPSTSGTRNYQPASDPALTPWTTHADLEQHGLDMILAAGDKLPFVGVGLPPEEHGRKVRECAAGYAAQRTYMVTPAGDRFVAIPHQEKRSGAGVWRPTGRRYIQLGDPSVGEHVVRFTPDCGVSDEDGDGKPKSPKRRAAERTVIATGSWCLDATAPCSYIDTDRQFHFRCWEPRDINPRFSPQVDAWIDSWGPDGADAIRDWVVTLGDLSKPAAALALVGGPGCGKDMFALAASAFFRQDGGPCDAKRASASFNADQRYTPIIVASERWPATWNGVDADINTIKELISSNCREINAKHQQPIKLLGCIRLIITANDLDFLPAPETLDRRSLDALRARFQVIEAPTGHSGISEPAEHLASAGGFQHTDRWIVDTGGGPGALVRHLAWLIKERAIARPDPSGRFFVETLPSRLGMALLRRSRIAGTVIDGIVSYLAGDRLRRLPPESIRVADGRVLVQIGRLYDSWAKLVAQQGHDATKVDARKMAPRADDFARVVAEALSEPGDVTVEGDSRTWKCLRLDFLLDHAHALGHDIEAVRARIASASAPVSATGTSEGRAVQ